MKHEGKRYNENKLRMDLVHPFAFEEMVKVLSYGSTKYQPRNWEQGMSWTSTIASLKRHLTAIENGEDYDEETGLLHASHVACNAHFLTAFYKIYPQGDDRPHKYLKPRKIGLDIDDVLADWTGSWAKMHGIDRPTAWQFDRDLVGKWQKMEVDGNIEEFYLNLPKLIEPTDIPFEPTCYITARTNVTAKYAVDWLDKNGFPAAPVVQVKGSKVEAIKSFDLDVYVDDRFENFREITNAGVMCYLMDAVHNKRYNVGHKRLYSLKDL